jgi:hypothetical protein
MTKSTSATSDIEPSLTISDFCAAEKISRAELYKLWRLNQGPVFYYSGAHRRITPEARREYQMRRAAEAAGRAQKASERAREAARVRAQLQAEAQANAAEASAAPPTRP